MKTLCNQFEYRRQACDMYGDSCEDMLEQYIFKNNQKLRYGYTTGSCAAAAAKAAAKMLLTGRRQSVVTLHTPKGICLELEVLDACWNHCQASCSILKDGGDDFDVTHGIAVCASVRRTESAGEVLIDGGLGVGRITRPGLDQEIGKAAINRVPRTMIEAAVREVMEESGYLEGLSVVIYVPRGLEIAAKTFNKRLGIEGGISILGTTGIVEPMSEKALIDTIRTEMGMLAAEGKDYLIITPGNYGEDFVKGSMDFKGKLVQCSNFIGEAIDLAYTYRLKGLLLAGHIGKLVKLGGGIMNTHSREADARMEILVSCSLESGVTDITLLNKLLAAATTDAALQLLEEAGCRRAVMNALLKRIDYHLKHRAYDGLKIGAVMFSNKFGELGRTGWAEELMKHIKEL